MTIRHSVIIPESTYHELLELRSVNAKLKADLRAAHEESGQLETALDGLREQLAARDADVKALRRWLQKQEHDCSKRGWFTICAVYRRVISQIDEELPTMKEVK